jgi:molecular chaperone GrpE
MPSSRASENAQAAQQAAGQQSDPQREQRLDRDAPPGAPQQAQGDQQAQASAQAQTGQPEAGQPPPQAQQPADGGAGTEERSEAQALADELARTTDRLTRALADLDNYRKRAAKDVQRLTTEARERLLQDWFEVADSIERALLQHGQGALAEGLRAVLGQIDAVLGREGIQRTGAPGEPFDPERHDAVGVREDDSVPEGTVVDVARSGYAAGDRVLRPAQVVVARRSQPAT